MEHAPQSLFPLLGIDIGGTKVAVCLGTNEGDIIESIRIPNKERPPSEVIPEIILASRDLMERHAQYGKVRAIGIGSPGPCDILNGVIVEPYNLPQWRNVPIREMLTQELQIPTFFDNDANAAAIAEWKFGSGKGCTDMIYITLSTGIGGGFIVNGRPMRGYSADGAEVHFSLDPEGPLCPCGIRGCYEAFCGGRAIAKRVQKELENNPHHRIAALAGGLEHIDMVAISKAVVEKEPYACKIWDEMCLRNAQAIGGLITIFNPQRIVLGTLANATGELFMTPFQNYLPRFTSQLLLDKTVITTSSLGRNLGELSGIAVALDGISV